MLDFGLARIGESEMTARTGGIEGPVERADQGLTMTGTLLGTPAYMAPEQFTRQTADARSDQFTFCVTLYEALYGHRPFAGETLAELSEAIITGQLAARPKDTRVPQWVHTALLRGLQTDPHKRWPSMPALLAELGRTPGARGRRIVAAVALVAGVGAVAGGVEGYRQWDVAQRVAACEAEGAVIDATWNDDARRRLRDAFAATGVSYAQTSAEKLMPWLDEASSSHSLVPAWRRHRSLRPAAAAGVGVRHAVACSDDRRRP